jgi:tRNA (guanine37-N1)-methyltransferase
MTHVSDQAAAGPGRIDVFTLFPDLIQTFASTSVLGRASKNQLVSINTIDLRSQAVGVHKTVDDSPFGGGAGMVLAPQPIFDCIEASGAPRPLFALGPGGRRFDQAFAHDLALRATGGGFSLLCGRYEGFDQRVHDHLTDGEISLGDFVLGGGEVAAMAVVEAVARLIPGVMGNEASAGDESFSDGLLEYPQYTRPATFRGWDVPDVLRSGDHGKTQRWRIAMSVVRTATHRPDLLIGRGGVRDTERAALAEFGLLDQLTEPWGSVARAEQAGIDSAAAAKRAKRKKKQRPENSEINT